MLDGRNNLKANKKGEKKRKNQGEDETWVKDTSMCSDNQHDLQSKKRMDAGWRKQFEGQQRKEEEERKNQGMLHINTHMN